jgi:hypothetical protein
MMNSEKINITAALCKPSFFPSPIVLTTREIEGHAQTGKRDGTIKNKIIKRNHAARHTGYGDSGSRSGSIFSIGR